MPLIWYSVNEHDMVMAMDYLLILNQIFEQNFNFFPKYF